MTERVIKWLTITEPDCHSDLMTERVRTWLTITEPDWHSDLITERVRTWLTTTESDWHSDLMTDLWLTCRAGTCCGWGACPWRPGRSRTCTQQACYTGKDFFIYHSFSSSLSLHIYIYIYVSLLFSSISRSAATVHQQHQCISSNSASATVH